jgi:hypothetical protein
VRAGSERRDDNTLGTASRRERSARRLALLVYAAGILVFRHAIMDDTFIHLQYARNLRAAGEIAFNHGEPSLGATSPLWMLLLAGGGAGPSGARLLSVACGALAVLAFGLLARRVLGPGAWAVAATTAWAGNLWLVRHAPMGMESSAAALAVLLAVDLRARGGRSAVRDMLLGFALAAAVLLRPEAALLAVLFVVLDTTTPWGRDRLAALLPACVLPLLAWYAFVHARTGELLPATGAAKAGGFHLAPAVWARVLARASTMLAAAHLADLVGTALAAALLLRLDGRRAAARLVRHPLAPYASFAILLLGGYAVADVQVQPRYLLLATPCVVLIGFAAWRRLLGDGSRAAAWVCVASLGLGAVAGAWRVYPATRDFARGLEGCLVPLARDAGQRGLAHATIAAPDIGVVGWYSGLRVLDLGGLVEPRMQRLVAAHGYDTVLEQGLFLDLGPVDFVLDRSLDRERFRDHVTRGLHWRVLRTEEMPGLGISRPETYHYTLYALEPPTALGGAGGGRNDPHAWRVFCRNRWGKTQSARPEVQGEVRMRRDVPGPRFPGVPIPL